MPEHYLCLLVRLFVKHGVFSLCIGSGMPVSRGVVEGPARIVLSLADAHTIQVSAVFMSSRCIWHHHYTLYTLAITQ